MFPPELSWRRSAPSLRLLAQVKDGAVCDPPGLRPVEHYIGVRRATIAGWITHCPIFVLCKETERRRGSTP